MKLLAQFKVNCLRPLVERWQGREIQSKLKALRHHAALPWKERRQTAILSLTNILQHAAQFVPYYRDLFREISFKPELVAENPKRLEDLPFLTKDIVRAQGIRLRDERFDQRSLHKRKTGGSTGPSAFFYYGQNALDWTAAANRLVLEWTGKKSYHREVHISTRFPGQTHWKNRLRGYVKCALLNRWNLETDSFQDNDLEKAWAFLRRVRPFVLQGHPSTVYALALYLKRKGRSGSGTVQVFESAGETLTQTQTQAIEQYLGCKVFNRYGSAEFGVVAHQTQNAYGAPLRVLDRIAWPEMAPAEAGNELVLTGLLNPEMPLIRYRTGDLAEVAEEEDGFVFRHLQGRVHDLVNLAGRLIPTHYLQDLLDRLPGIDEFQCEQLAGGRLKIRLAVSEAARRPVVAKACEDWWKDAVAIEFVDITQLKRVGAASKFRHLVLSEAGQ